MTVEEAAKYLFVSRSHIRALLASGSCSRFCRETSSARSKSKWLRCRRTGRGWTLRGEPGWMRRPRTTSRWGPRRSGDLRPNDSWHRTPPLPLSGSGAITWLHRFVTPSGQGERQRGAMVQLADRRPDHKEVRREEAQPFCRMATPLRFMAEEHRPRRNVARWVRFHSCVGARRRSHCHVAASMNYAGNHMGIDGFPKCLCGQAGQPPTPGCLTVGIARHHGRGTYAFGK